MANRLETFSRSLKSEISSLDFTGKENLGLISGFALTNGVFSLLGNNKARLILKTEVASCAKLVFNIFKYQLNIENTHIIYQNKTKFKTRVVYNIEIKGEIIPLIEELEIKKNLMTCIPDNMVKKDYVRGFICGIFLGGGSLSDPNKSYFLEISFDELEIAEFVQNTLNNLYLQFEDVLEYSFKVIKRRNKYVVYMKKSENISNLLSFLGCTNTMLNFENIRIEKDFLNSQNRIDNCVVINYKRSLKTAQENVELLDKILKIKPFDFFNEKEKAIIQARMKYTDLTYSELVDVILHEFGVNVSKSYICSFFNKLKEDLK